MKKLECPNCGGSMEISDDRKKIICPYCDIIFPYVEPETRFFTRQYETVLSICSKYVPITVYVTVGESLKDYTCFKKSQKNLKIPEDADACLIFDTSVWGKCKKGFVLCTEGIYYRDDSRFKKQGFISYSDFRFCEIQIADYTLLIDDIEFTCDNDAALELSRLLTKIQEALINME